MRAKYFLSSLFILFWLFTADTAIVSSRPAHKQNHETRQNYQNALKHLGRIYYNARNGIYAGYNRTLYCGCRIIYNGKKPKKADHDSCGFRYRKNEKKGMKIEWEHMMPVHRFAGNFSCWKAGGRKSCQKNQGYRYIEGDMHNIAPAIGEINSDRGNYPFADIKTKPYQYGKCQMVVDFRRHIASPPPAARGAVARAYLYMSKRYSIKLVPEEEKLYNFWHKHYPPTKWECYRNTAIARIQGNENKFISDSCKQEIK
jgi:deoxyribonuclease-1